MSVKLSVIIPAYNAEKTIHRCLDSIVNQTFHDFEVIIINDGSKDNTLNILEEYQLKYDFFKMFNIDNHGVSYARNLGIDNSNGTYITFVDSDDYIENDFFEQLVNKIESSNSDIVIAGLSVLSYGEIIERKMISQDISTIDNFWNVVSTEYQNFGYIGSKIYKTEIIKKNNIRFNNGMKSQEDLNFNLDYYSYCSKMEKLIYAGYIYEYYPSKREVPFIDLILNQIKIYSIANKKTKLSINSITCIYERILKSFYCYLYESRNKNEFDSRIVALKTNPIIYNYLKNHISINKEKYMNWFINGQYNHIYVYLFIRKKLGLIKRIFVK